MGNNIDNETQLDLYDVFVTVFLTDNALKHRFPKSNFFEFEPNLQSLNFSQLPYIVIAVPLNDPSFISLDHSLNLENLEVPIVLVMDYSARANVKNYLQKMKYVLEKNESVFDHKGYFNLKFNIESVGPEMIDQKQVVTARISVTFNGAVCRDNSR